MRRPPITPGGRCKQCGWASADCDCGEPLNTLPDDGAGPFESESQDGLVPEELDFDVGGEG